MCECETPWIKHAISGSRRSIHFGTRAPCQKSIMPFILTPSKRFKGLMFCAFSIFISNVLLCWIHPLTWINQYKTIQNPKVSCGTILLVHNNTIYIFFVKLCALRWRNVTYGWRFSSEYILLCLWVRLLNGVNDFLSRK